MILQGGSLGVRSVLIQVMGTGRERTFENEKQKNEKQKHEK